MSGMEYVYEPADCDTAVGVEEVVCGKSSNITCPAPSMTDDETVAASRVVVGQVYDGPFTLRPDHTGALWYSVSPPVLDEYHPGACDCGRACIMTAGKHPGQRVPPQ